MKKIFITIVFVLSFYIGYSQCNNPIDYHALRALYIATDGDNWIDKSGWPDATTFNINITPPVGTDMNLWKGISCQANRVIRINFDDNNLSGIIPIELGTITELTELEIIRNNLIDTIPRSLANLQKLIKLNFYDNNISGSIPKELIKLQNLEILWLPRNNLSGKIPHELGELKNLKSLGLFWNQLVGTIPKELKALSNLRILNFSHNNLTGNIPIELGELSNLVLLSLSRNQLNGNIPNEIGFLSNLEELSLFSNLLVGNIPKSLGNLSKLKELYLQKNNLDGSIPPELGKLTNLESLKLSDNNLSCFVPQEVINAHCHLGFTAKFDTLGYDLTNNPLLPFKGDMERICNGKSQIGAFCDDGNDENGISDVIDSMCHCGPQCPIIKLDISYSNTVCFGTKDTILFKIENGVPPYTLIWSESTVNNLKDGDYLVVDPGEYTFTSIIDGNGCNSSVTSKIKITESSALPAIISDKTTICKGDTIELSAPAGYSYTWFDDNKTLSSESFIDVFASGNYYLKISDGNCQKLDTLFIDEFAPIPIDIFGKTSLCKGDSIDLAAPSGYNYTWYSDNKTLSTDQKLIVIKPGNYYLKMSDSNCSLLDTIYIEEFDPVNFEIEGDTEFCEGDTIKLSGPTGYNYSWFNTNNKISNAQNLILTEPGDYYLIISNGICEALDAISVKSLPYPEVLTKDMLDIVFTEDLKLDVDYGGDIKFYKWSPSSALNCSDCPYPILIDNIDEVYQVQVENKYGCLSTGQIMVRFKNNSEYSIYYPNIISSNPFNPNNGIFYLQSEEEFYYDLSIYNRWGNKLFDKKDILCNNPSQGWEPISTLNSGVYIYMIKYEIDKKTFVKVGDITLIK